MGGGPPQGLPGPSGPEPRKSPKRVRKESGKSTLGEGPKVPKECAPEFQKSPKRVRRSGIRLFSDSFETLSALFGPCPGGVLFRTLFGLLKGSGPEGCGAGPIAMLEQEVPKTNQQTQ